MKPFKKFLTLKEDITNFVNTNLSEARIHIDDYKHGSQSVLKPKKVDTVSKLFKSPKTKQDFQLRRTERAKNLNTSIFKVFEKVNKITVGSSSGRSWDSLRWLGGCFDRLG